MQTGSFLGLAFYILTVVAIAVKAGRILAPRTIWFVMTMVCIYKGFLTVTTVAGLKTVPKVTKSKTFWYQQQLFPPNLKSIEQSTQTSDKVLMLK